MALGSTQPLTEMSTRSIFPGGKGGRCVKLTTLPPSGAVVTKSENLNFLEPSGPVTGLLYLLPTIVQYVGVTAEYHHDLQLRTPHTSTTCDIKLRRHHLLFTF